MRTFSFKVEIAGSGTFPLDLLWKETLCPYTEEDSTQIAQTFEKFCGTNCCKSNSSNIAIDPTTKQWQIALYRAAAPLYWKPNIVHWEKLGYSILSVIRLPNYTP